jgi:hypothetical protein
MITTTLVSVSSLTVPQLVFTSSNTGAALSPPTIVGQPTAVTTLALCNIHSPVTDEITGSVTVNIYFAKAGIGYQNFELDGTTNLVVSQLTVPAGETVFFSDERIILDAGDQIYVGTSAANKLCVTVSSMPV